MSSLDNRLKKIEKEKSIGKGFWSLPFVAFYGMRNCPSIWQEKPGTLTDFYESDKFCEGCTAEKCKMDDCC